MKCVLDVYFAWAQNATFFKKLRFGLSQTHFIANFFIYARFGLQKVQTNARTNGLGFSIAFFECGNAEAVYIRKHSHIFHFLMSFCNFLFATNFGQLLESHLDLGFVQTRYCWKANKIIFITVQNLHQLDV